MGKGLNGGELSIILSVGLVKLSMLADPTLYLSTRKASELLDVTPRQVTEYVLSGSLPRISRDRYYLPDLLNWIKVKAIADRLRLKPQDLEGFSFVDFSLGGEYCGPRINEKTLSAVLRGGNDQPTSKKKKRPKLRWRSNQGPMIRRKR